MPFSNNAPRASRKHGLLRGRRLDPRALPPRRPPAAAAVGLYGRVLLVPDLGLAALVARDLEGPEQGGVDGAVVACGGLVCLGGLVGGGWFLSS
jgi:hypothetical protein